MKNMTLPWLEISLKGEDIETSVLCEMREPKACFQRLSVRLYKTPTVTFSQSPLKTH